MRLWKIVKIVLFCMVFVLLLDRIYTILSWKDTAGDYHSSLDSYYDLEEDIVDVVFFGSSHCYGSFDPSVFWDDYGIASFNLAISGQDFAATYYTMKEAIKTQSPKLFVVDLFGSTFTGYAVEGNVYRNTLPFKYSKNSYELIDSLVKDEERKMDFWARLPIFHTRYKELKKEDFDTNLPTYLGYSAGYVANSVGELIYYDTEESTPFPEERNEWFFKMIELAKENDIELCFVVAPYVADEADQKLIKYAKDVAAENNIPVVDFIQLGKEIGLDTNTDFGDWGHLNHRGATKVSEYLSDYIAKNYDLEDYRGDERYALWDDNSKLRNHEEQNRDLKYSYDLTAYVDKITKFEDYVIVVSTAGNHLSDSADISADLDKLGIGSEFYSGGFWVIEDGEMVYMTTDTNAFKNISLGTNDIVISRAEGENSVIVNKEQYKIVNDGINILVFDKGFGVVADHIGFSSPHDYAVAR